MADETLTAVKMDIDPCTKRCWDGSIPSYCDEAYCPSDPCTPYDCSSWAEAQGDPDRPCHFSTEYPCGCEWDCWLGMACTAENGACGEVDNVYTCHCTATCPAPGTSCSYACATGRTAPGHHDSCCGCEPNCTTSQSCSTSKGTGHLNTCCDCVLTSCYANQSCRTADGVKGHTTGAVSGPDDCYCAPDCTPNASCRTTSGVNGHYNKDCVCEADCTLGGGCEGIAGKVYDKDCNCHCSSKGTACTSSGGGWNSDTCHCDCNTSIGYSSGGSCHCKTVRSCQNGGHWHGYKDGCYCDCSSATKPDNAHWVSGSYTCAYECNACPQENMHYGANCTCLCNDCTGGKVHPEGSCACVCPDCAEGRHHPNENDCSCLCGYDDDERAIKVSACDGSGGTWLETSCSCSCPGGKSVRADGTCPCENATECHNGGTPRDRPYCDCDCSGAESVRVACVNSGQRWVPEDCTCSPCPSGQRWDAGQGKCVCNERKTCENGGTWKDTPTCACDCSTRNCGAKGKPVSGSATCACECAATPACANGGRPTAYPDCGCDCSTAAAQNVKAACKDEGMRWNGDRCSCDCLEGATCHAQPNNVIGTMHSNCVCEPKCTYHEKCHVGGAPGKLNENCVCEADCTPGGRCYEGAAPGIWQVEGDECVCNTCDSMDACRTDAGVIGHRSSDDCHCIANCVYPNTCTKQIGACSAVPGNVNKDCECVETCTPGVETCTATVAGKQVPGKKRCDCSCEPDCTPGSSCTRSGKSGIYDDRCVCQCRAPGISIACEKGTEGGELDENCACRCYKAGDDCLKGGVGAGYVDPSCNCQCRDESTHSLACSLSGGTWLTATCECSCPEGKYLKGDGTCACTNGDRHQAACEAATSGGTWDPLNCACSCPAGTYPGTDWACHCDNEEIQIQACSRTPKKTWVGAPTCKCDCVDAVQKEEDCIFSGDDFWNMNHEWVPDDCDCVCTDVSALGCDSRFGVWSHGDCKCDCFSSAPTFCEDSYHYFKADPYCECKCKDISREQKCVEGETPGTWSDTACTCTCPAGSKLVNDVCRCENEATEKPPCVRAGGESAWKPAVCTCCSGESSLKSMCETAAPALHSQAGAWDADACKCDCPGNTMWITNGCYCDPQSVLDCGTSAYDYANCKCKCDSAEALALKAKCQTSSASASGASWSETGCTCSCSNLNKAFNGTKCECVNITDKSDCDRVKTIDPNAYWSDTDCKCACDRSTEGLSCTTASGGKGRWRNCKCVCEDAGKKCGGEGMYYDAQCKCACRDENKECATHGKEKDGRLDAKCACKCAQKGVQCTLKTPNDGVKDANCNCKCATTGQPCAYVAGDLESGKVWEDCSCVCKRAGAQCDNPEGHPGGVGWVDPETCSCKCAPDGTRCTQKNGNMGWTKDCECTCDEEKLEEACEKKAEESEFWMWNPTGCSCDCTLTAAECEADGKLLNKKACVCGPCSTDLPPCPEGKFRDPETCKCEDCDPTISCRPQSVLNESSCQCECREDELETCPTGKHHVVDLGCACACDKDESACVQGIQVWNEQTCKCECNEVYVRSQMGGGWCTNGHLDDDCACVCDKTAASCNEFQTFNEMQCECECLLDDASCATGKHRNSKCECVCDKDASMCDPEFQEWDSDNCKCVCIWTAQDCADAGYPNSHPDENCACVCDKTAASCNPTKQYWAEEECDCKCLDCGVDNNGVPIESDAKCNCKECTNDGTCPSDKGHLASWPDCSCICNQSVVTDCQNKGEHWKLDAGCNCYCSLSASTCKAEGKSFNADSCTCGCNLTCAIPTPDLNAALCTCECIPGNHWSADCDKYGFDQTNCKCNSCDQSKVKKPSDYNEKCYRFDGEECSYVTDTTDWDSEYASWKSGIESKKSGLSGACAGLGGVQTIPAPSDRDIDICASSNYAYVANCQRAAEKARNAANTICGKVDTYITGLNTLLKKTFTCPDSFDSVDDPPDVSQAQSNIQVALEYISILKTIDDCLCDKEAGDECRKRGENWVWDATLCNCNCTVSALKCGDLEVEKGECACGCSKKDHETCTKKGGSWTWSGYPGCTCDCPIKASDCAAENREYDSEGCKCGCNKADKQICQNKTKSNPNWEWNPTSCHCDCGLSESACSRQGKTLDPTTCTCGCSKDAQEACRKKGGSWEFDTTNCGCNCPLSESACAAYGRDFDSVGCKCVCSASEKAACDTKMATNTNWRWLDYPNCLCNCTLSSATCLAQGRSLDPATCTCGCSMAGKTPPSNCSDPKCHRWVEGDCTYVCDTSEWDGAYSAWWTDLKTKRSSGEGKCTGNRQIQDIPEPSDAAIAQCASNNYMLVLKYQLKAAQARERVNTKCDAMSDYVNTIDGYLTTAYQCPDKLPSVGDPPDMSGVGDDIELALSYITLLQNIADCPSAQHTI